ncbi:hypothetical protein F4811DRAFT_521264 [Daldinia bambusicola]|nr:hypothetical protein F4811DRAFT_521264 [Daldinia bambusicola]
MPTLPRWHCGLKPGNILRVNGEFKLADFGFAMFKQANPNGFPVMGRITDGTETYGAPECDCARSDHPIKVSQKIDTWSFGCVLSVSATWVVLGYPGVVRYHKHRQIAIQKLKKRQAKGENISVPVGDDAFHNGLVVLPEVKEWHDYLRSVSRRSDTITPRILDLVEDTMLLVESARLSKAKALYPVLEEQLRLARAGPAATIAESVKEALLSIGDDESSLANASSSKDTISSTDSVVSDRSNSASFINHCPRHNRINKFKKIGEIVHGKVAHRQEALRMEDEQLNEPITQAAQHYPITENGSRDIGSWYVRRPAPYLLARTSNLSPLTSGPIHELTQPVGNHFIYRPPDTHIKNTVAPSRSLQPISASCAQNTFDEHEGLLTEIPTDEFDSVPIPTSRNPSLRVTRPLLSTYHEIPRTPALPDEFRVDPIHSDIVY